MKLVTAREKDAEWLPLATRRNTRLKTTTDLNPEKNNNTCTKKQQGRTRRNDTSPNLAPEPYNYRSGQAS